ncbi:ribbon-helix-helix domain-containing protein [Lacibacterium aquatile]|uniref:Ribbon-helix-helix domain-containing protein n=1 Tax=Lacibacterium aquatile TaxID=1168082 RepID=A0ABW5DZD0_9PROT
MQEPLDPTSKDESGNNQSRRFTLSDAVTEVSLPAALWAALTDIARNEGLPLVALLARIAKVKGVRPLEEALWSVAILWHRGRRNPKE